MTVICMALTLSDGAQSFIQETMFLVLFCRDRAGQWALPIRPGGPLQRDVFAVWRQPSHVFNLSQLQTRSGPCARDIKATKVACGRVKDH